MKVKRQRQCVLPSCPLGKRVRLDLWEGSIKLSGNHHKKKSTWASSHQLLEEYSEPESWFGVWRASAASHWEPAGPQIVVMTFVSREGASSLHLDLITLWWLSWRWGSKEWCCQLESNNGQLCCCQQYFWSGWFKRVFPTSDCPLIHETRENLLLLQVKTSSHWASSGAVL